MPPFCRTIRRQHSDRSYFHFTDITDFKRGMRFDADIASVSDSHYFQDFAVGSDATSVTFLERRADLLYYDDAWRVRGELQNFQTIDILNVQHDLSGRLGRGTAPGVLRRAALLARAADPGERACGPWPTRTSNSPWTARSSISCARSVPRACASTWRRRFAGRRRGPGYFFEPAVGYDFTQYDLKNADAGGPNLPSTPTRALPYARLDTGLVFEREAGSQGSALKPSSRAWSTATCPIAIRTSCRFSIPDCPT